MKKTTLLLITAFFLIAPLFLIQQKTLAGDPNCQSGYITNPYNPPAYPTPTPRFQGNVAEREEKRFAVAQFRNGRNQMPPGNGFKQTASRFDFAGLAAVAVTLGGLWLLFVLLARHRGDFFCGRRAQSNRRMRFADFALKPSFAFFIFGLLILGTIIGSQIAAPIAAVSAKQREKPDKQTMTGLMNPSNKPVFKTAQAVGGDALTQIGAPVFDAAGNRYVRGTFTGNLNIGSTTLHASAYLDLFFAKYDPNGDPVWARQATGATPEIAAIEGATALAVDASGNVYVGGSFVKKITLPGGANSSVTLTDAGGTGVNYESFVAKYNANGDLLWAKGGASGSPQSTINLETGQNAIDQIVIGSDDSPYIAGFVSGSNFFGSPTVVNGESDILLAKLDAANGTVVWKKVIGGTKDDNGLSLKIDGANNLYLNGNFGSPTITFPTVPATTFGNLDNPEGTLEDSTNAFVAKFDTNGNNLWAKNLNNTETVGGSQIAVNGAGEIYLTGYYFDSVTFPTAPETTLTETEGSGEDEDALGGYVTKMDTNGNFIWAKGFGGVGEAIALDAAGRVHIVGTFWDGGTFGAATANEDTLASFGGEDLFVARYDANGGFDWAKPIAGSGQEGQTAIGNTDAKGGTDNAYNPLGIGYNPATGTMFVSSDFSGVIALDCLILQTSGDFARHSYIAELTADSETTNCRIWNGLDADDNNWDSTDNWNGGIIPINGDNVYVPYTGNNFDAPTYNPASDVFLGNVTVADDRILTLEKDLNVGERLNLLGGFIDAGDTNTVSLGAFTDAFTINDGRVIGKVKKVFAAFNGSFTFPVGTENGYSPVTVSNISLGESYATFAVAANQGAYPNTANNLPVNRAARWWNLTNDGLSGIDLTFKYLPGDITTITESQYRAYRIPTGGGGATQVLSTIDTTAKTVFAPNISQFSDWTLAQPATATAASVTVSGRALSNNRAVSNVRISMTDANGVRRNATTNTFGYYRFAGVPAGGTYVFEASAKRFKFVTQVLNINEDLNELNFTVK